MDQLVIPGDARQLNYFVGRKYANGSTYKDRYLDESTPLRNAYQLEVGSASVDSSGAYTFGATVEDFLNSLSFYGVDKSDLRTVLGDDFKPADFKINLDKLVNYSEYYWLPNGPQPILVDFSTDNDLYIKMLSLSTGSDTYFDGQSFYVTSNNHPTRNPPLPTLDAFPNTTVDRAIANTLLSFRIPRSPATVQTQNQIAVESASMVGVAVDGQPFYTYTMGSKEQLGGTTYTINTVFLENHSVTFTSTEIDTTTSFNRNEDELHVSPTPFNGHPDINGVLHYHAFTNGLVDSTDVSPTLLNHSRILGFAFDGFPIYGPKGFTNADGSGPVIRVTSSYRLKSATADRGTPDGRYVEDYEYVAGLGMLDANNGRFCVTPDFPLGTYAYFLTTDSTGTTPTFPYVVGPKWSGRPIQQSGTIQVPEIASLFSGVPALNVDSDIIGKDRFIYGSIEFMNGLKVKFNNTATPSFYRNKEFYVEGVGSSIKLIPVLELVPNLLDTPTLYVEDDDTYDSSAYDTNEYDGIEFAVLDKHYLTINRASQDRNPWSRSNRWFHYRVLAQTARQLGSDLLIDNQLKATRPIIEFDANLALFNHAHRTPTYVDVVDLSELDALSNIQGSRGAIVDGIPLVEGMRVVFTADVNPVVRETVYEVSTPTLSQNRVTTQTIPVPALADPPNYGPYEWLTNLASAFSFPGDFRNRVLELIRTDGTTTAVTYLNPTSDYTSSVVFNPQAILTIAVTTSGNQYSTANPPVVTITGDGTGATAIALVASDSSIVGIAITNPGSGYTTATVTIGPPQPLGGAAQAYAQVQNIGIEQRATVTLSTANPTAATYTLNVYDVETTIALSPVSTLLDYDGVWASQGLSNKGKGYYILSQVWYPSQTKTITNQAPLFDLVDTNNISVGNRSTYTGTTFIGTKLFSYAVGTGKNDPVLGFPLSYKSLGLTGDIQFTWDHSTDTHQITTSTTTAIVACESFYALDTATSALRGIVQDTARLSALPVLDLRFITESTSTVDLKVSALDSTAQETILVELNDQPLYRGKDFDVASRVVTGHNLSLDPIKQTKPNAQLLFRSPLQINDKLLITQWTNDDISQTDLVWRLPLSITVNPINSQIGTLTFSDVASHLVSGAQLLKTLSGDPLEDNNLQNEPSLPQLCSKFGYNNGNTLMAMALLKNRSLGFIQSLEYSRDEFTKFKNTVIQQFDFASFDDNDPIPTMFDNLISTYVQGKTADFPFYDSDMIPGATNFVSKQYTVRFSQDKTYPLSAPWSNYETSRVAVLVYHNSTLLTRYQDYNFDGTLSSLTIVPTYPISVGDTIIVREYNTTTANWIATTPSKLGLYPTFTPGIVTLPHPKGNVTMIRGHDGSMMPTYGDQRDELALELENRIYNNIKQGRSLVSDQVLAKFNPIPGFYRSTSQDYSNAINIFDRAFGQWILKSKLPYTDNTSFTIGDPWSWNYRNQQDAYGNTVLQGNWFGIYRYYFDTEYPHMEPWKMLGFSDMPNWWTTEYGPSPYTKQNAKLWNDIEAGLIRQGPRAGTDLRYARKYDGSSVSLQSVIPVNDHGELLPPTEAGLVQIVNRNTINYDWIFGDGAPVEQAWRRSSEYPFAIQAYWALVNSRFYFGTAFDLLDLTIDPTNNSIQHIYDTSITSLGKVVRQIDISNSFSNVDGAGYFNWIEARAKALNIAPADFQSFVAGITPRLMLRMSGYTDKDKLKVYINSVTPGSKNASSLLPDDNYQLLLDQSSPTSNLVYSGVIVTKTDAGWKVEGYDTERTYFLTLPSIHSGSSQPVRVGDKLADYLTWEPGQYYAGGQIVKNGSTFYRVLRDHTSAASFSATPQTYAALQDLPMQGGVVATLWTTYESIPAKVYYGTVYKSAQEVFDFLQSYGKFLESQGFIFDQYDSDLGEIRNWLLSGKEFLYWTLQNWNTGSAITLSPSSQYIQIYIPQGDMDPLYGIYADPDGVVDQNGSPLVATDIAVDRNFDVVTVTPTNPDKNIFLLKAIISDFDHLAVFDLTTDFSDVIYDPTTGSRQDRFTIKGSKSNGWNGKLFAPGFTLDLADVQGWFQYVDYYVGDLVKVGNITYVAIANHNSGSLFDYSKWTKMIKQPYKHLQENLDTLANRMEKFYDLNSEQVASDVSSYARHLIAFQPRSYLNDLLVNDETQFKFYQGMITQKGTSAAVDKLSRGSNPGGIPVVTISDEWALRVGEFGLANNSDTLDIALTTDDLQFDKVMLDLTGTQHYDRNVVGIPGNNIIDYGDLVPPTFFPTAPADFKQKVAGYAILGQVDAAVLTHDQIATVNSTLMNESGKLIWVAKSPATVSAIYRTDRTGTYTVTVKDNSVIMLSGKLPLNVGDNIWIDYLNAPTGTLSSISGFQTVATVPSPTTFTITGATLTTGETATAYITRYLPVEYPDFNTCTINTMIAATRTDPATITFQDVHKFINRERVFIDGIVGMTQLNGMVAFVKVINVKTISLYQDIDLSIPLNSQSYTDYISGGLVYSCDIGVSKRLYDLPVGERLWIDSYTTGWNVFVKTRGWGNGTLGIQPTSSELPSTNNFGTAIHSWEYIPGLVWAAFTSGFNISAGQTNQVVFIFQRSVIGDQLAHVTYLRGKVADVTDACSFGTAISHLDTTTLIIGAPNDSTALLNNGAIQIWERTSGNAWESILTLRAPTPIMAELFGTSFARVNEFVVLISAPGSGTIYKLVKTVTYDPITNTNIVTYGVTPVLAGLTTMGLKMAISGNVLAVLDTDTNGHVGVYTVDSTGALTLQLTVDGTTEVPITSSSAITISTANNKTHLAISNPSLDSIGIVQVYELNTSTITWTATLMQVLLPKTIQGSNTFGSAVSFADNGTLLVGNPIATESIATTFDIVTSFDSGITTFHDPIANIGTVESYGWYGGSFVWDGSLLPPPLTAGTNFGKLLSQSGNHVFVGEPTNGVGKVDEFIYSSVGWVTENQQAQLVNTPLVNRALDYDPVKDTVANFLSIWDPLKNRHDSNAIINVDAETASDPAVYQQDSPGTAYWAAERVGTTWWDPSNTIWLWYEQGDLSYRIKNWGQLFPGADIVVSEWIESTVVPSAYNVNNVSPEMGYPPLGDAQPYNTIVRLDSSGAYYYTYYFWVTNKSTIAQGSNKSMSVAEIRTALINGPDKWVAAASDSAVLTYGLRDDLSNGVEVLQLEILRREQDKPKHVEWILLSEGDDTAPPQQLINKMIDSLVGSDIQGNVVPETSLPPHRKIGIKIRPRQSMFVDRISAIETSTEFLNDQLATMILGNQALGDLLLVDNPPIATEIQDVTFDGGDTIFDTETTSFTGTAVNWNLTVNTYEDIAQSSQLLAYPPGYKILVLHDETHDNYWSTYIWDGKDLNLNVVQNFDTTKFWSRIDYYSTIFPVGSIPDLTVDTEQEFLDGDYAGLNVKVLGPKYWRVLTKDSANEITILAMQNGTIKINLTSADFASTLSYDSANFDSTLFDPIPTIELRNILSAMQNTILIDQYLPAWNSWFFRMLRYALTEQKQLDWAFKSSFIKVKNTIASLSERPVYSLDVQDSLENYITEVKPYHTKIREYVTSYTGEDTMQNLPTDFDAPPYNGMPVNVNDSTQAELFNTQWPYRAYRDGRGYSIIAIVITNGGSGYISEPTVSFQGGTRLQTATTTPQATAIVGVAPQSFDSLGDNNYFTFRKTWLDKQASKDSSIDTTDLPIFGQPISLLASMAGTNAYGIKRINVDIPGDGYLSPPEVIITGGGGTGATAYAVLGHAQVRMLRTGMKFDRVKGTSDILFGDVRNPSYDNPSYDDWHGADRIAAYYKPVAGQPGIPLRTTMTYIGDGITTVFNLPYAYRNPLLLQVALQSLADSTATMVDPSAFTIHELARTLEFDVAPAVGTTVTLALNPPLTGLLQGADFDHTLDTGPGFDSGPGFDQQSFGFDSVPYDDWELDPSGGLVESQGIDTYQQSGRFVTASGYDPTANIVTDGQYMLSPENIPNTEELIAGQVFDTLDMRVFSLYEATYTGFRIIKDMLGKLKYYVITETTSTTVTLHGTTQNDTAIILDSVAGLHVPDPVNNIPGIIMLEGERIEYWTLDPIGNTLTNLRRGTDGTAAAPHAIGAYATSINAENEIPPCDVMRKSVCITDGSTSIYDLPIQLVATPSRINSQVSVYLGGKKQTNFEIITSVTPDPSVPIGSYEYVSVSFAFTPDAGLELIILIKQSETWYDLTAPSSLRSANTLWANFMNAESAPPGMAV